MAIRHFYGSDRAMMLLVTYDVNTTHAAGARRLRRVAKCCMAYGQRVQNSVFECSGEYATLLEMKQRLLSIIDHNEDSLRFYNLGNRYSEKIEHHGVKPSYDPEGFLVH